MLVENFIVFSNEMQCPNNEILLCGLCYIIEVACFAQRVILSSQDLACLTNMA